MKNAWKFGLMVMFFGVFFNCDVNDHVEKNPDYDNAWNLKNIKGGLAGVNEDFADKEIQWFFGSNGTLQVLFNEDNVYLYKGLSQGSYPYEIREISGNSYLFINDTEFGSYNESNNQLIIDQNERSNGSGADGFILQFTM